MSQQNILLQGKQVCLCNFTMQDIEKRVRWLSDPLVNRNLILREPIEYKKTLKWYKEVQSDASRKDLVIDLHCGKSIGCIGLRKINLLSMSACFYIFIGEKEYWGQGIGKEASHLLFDWAFNQLNLNKIWSNVASYNTASLALLKKIGFVQEGYLRQEEIINNRKIDIIRFGLLASEFKARTCE